MKNGYVLSRQEQINRTSENKTLSQFIEKYLNPNWQFNWNGLNHISISKKQSDISDDKESDAFKEYVIGNAGIGIILSLDVINLKDSSRTKLMDGEIQIKDLIPLKYMLGIFFGGKSNNELLKDIKRAETPGISKSEIKELLPHTLTPNQNEIYNKIQELLCKYGYNVPIYSSRDGFQSSDIENILEVPELSD